MYGLQQALHELQYKYTAVGGIVLKWDLGTKWRERYHHSDKTYCGIMTKYMPSKKTKQDNNNTIEITSLDTRDTIIQLPIL